MKIKITTGYRRDQEHSIPVDEAHKAYFLFNNPDHRTVFSTGLALRGEQIQSIVPDWQGTMGWNPSHVLDSDDWNEIHAAGLMDKMQRLLAAAKELGSIGNAADLNQPLTALLTEKYPKLFASAAKLGMQGVKEIATPQV
jgi:hypothetical protein